MRNLNIAYLIIDGDHEDNWKLDPFIKNETNNILMFEDKFQTFFSKIDSYFTDVNNFMSLENKEFLNAGNMNYKLFNLFFEYFLY